MSFLWRYPWSRLRRTLSGTVFPWSPDFPPALLAKDQRPSGHLTLLELVIPGSAAQARATLGASTLEVNLVQQCGKDRYDRNDHEQFNKGESGRTGSELVPEFKVALRVINRLFAFVHINIQGSRSSRTADDCYYDADIQTDACGKQLRVETRHRCHRWLRAISSKP